MFDADLLQRAGERLERHLATLAPDDQAAVRALLLRAAADRAPLLTLGSQPAGAVLSAEELVVYERLSAEPAPTAIGGRPALTVIMKATRLCNLRCTYCHSWRDGPNQVMTFEVLARAIRDTLRDPSVRSVDFVWHGGEVTLLPPTFYRKALWLQQQYRRPDQVVHNAVQTNGTNLSDDWVEFLRAYGFGVGVSLDGPPEVHDRRRVDRAGRPTSARVRAGLEQLRAAGVTRYGVLMVVDEAVCTLGPQRLLDYLLEIQVEGVDLLNVIPENTAPSDAQGSDYLPLPRYVEFLRGLFQLWWPTYADRIKIRELATLAAQVRGGQPLTCNFAGDCFGGYLTIEPTGEVSACDKYIADEEYTFGSVLTTNLAALQQSNRLTAVRGENQEAVDRMRACPWFGVCQGGCPHDRYMGERRLPGYDGTCCGFAPLLQDMATAFQAAENRPSSSRKGV